MAQVSVERELLTLVLGFLFSGEHLPYLPLINMIDPSILLPVGKLPRDAWLKHFMEQLSIFLNIRNFKFNGFCFIFSKILFTLVAALMMGLLDLN